MPNRLCDIAIARRFSKALAMARSVRMVEQATRMVFARRVNVAMAIGVFATMLLVMLLTADYVFIEPYLIAHVPEGGVGGLAIIVVMSALSAMAIPMGIHSIMAARAARRGIAGGMAGATVGVVAGACSCGPITLALATSLGAAGSATASFLSEYDVPLRLAAIAALGVSIYATSATLSGQCRTP